MFAFLFACLGFNVHLLCVVLERCFAVHSIIHQSASVCSAFSSPFEQNDATVITTSGDGLCLVQIDAWRLGAIGAAAKALVQVRARDGAVEMFCDSTSAAAPFSAESDIKSNDDKCVFSQHENLCCANCDLVALTNSNTLLKRWHARCSHEHLCCTHLIVLHFYITC